MQGNPDHQTGFNLVLCYYALEDGLSMKKAFQRLAAIPVQVIALGPSVKDALQVTTMWCMLDTFETQAVRFGL